MQFIAATRNLRRLDQSDVSVADFVQACFDADIVDELLSLRNRVPSKACLVRQRPRLDCVMLLMQRHYIRQVAIRTRPVAYYMLVDGSPSSGYEAFSVMS